MTESSPISSTGGSYGFFHPVMLLSTWFGAGLSPVAPGTAGSLAALPLAFAVQYYCGNEVLLLLALLVFALGVVVSDLYVRRTGRDDPKEVVIDEVAGQWLILAFLYPTGISYLVGFALFRFFDVLKPWPICVVDRNMKGGAGVMLDDLLAALYPVVIVAFAFAALSLVGAAEVLQPIGEFLQRGTVSF